MEALLANFQLFFLQKSKSWSDLIGDIFSKPTNILIWVIVFLVILFALSRFNNYLEVRGVDRAIYVTRGMVGSLMFFVIAPIVIFIMLFVIALIYGIPPPDISFLGKWISLTFSSYFWLLRCAFNDNNLIQENPVELYSVHALVRILWTLIPLTLIWLRVSKTRVGRLLILPVIIAILLIARYKKANETFLTQGFDGTLTEYFAKMTMTEKQLIEEHTKIMFPILAKQYLRVINEEPAETDDLEELEQIAEFRNEQEKLKRKGAEISSALVHWGKIQFVRLNSGKLRQQIIAGVIIGFILLGFGIGLASEKYRVVGLIVVIIGILGFFLITPSSDVVSEDNDYHEDHPINVDLDSLIYRMDSLYLAPEDNELAIYNMANRIYQAYEYQYNNEGDHMIDTIWDEHGLCYKYGDYFYDHCYKERNEYAKGFAGTLTYTIKWLDKPKSKQSKADKKRITNRNLPHTLKVSFKGTWRKMEIWSKHSKQVFIGNNDTKDILLLLEKASKKKGKTPDRYYTRLNIKDVEKYQKEYQKRSLEVAKMNKLDKAISSKLDKITNYKNQTKVIKNQEGSLITVKRGEYAPYYISSYSSPKFLPDWQNTLCSWEELTGFMNYSTKGYPILLEHLMYGGKQIFTLKEASMKVPKSFNTKVSSDYVQKDYEDFMKLSKQLWVWKEYIGSSKGDNCLIMDYKISYSDERDATEENRPHQMRISTNRKVRQIEITNIDSTYKQVMCVDALAGKGVVWLYDMVNDKRISTRILRADFDAFMDEIMKEKPRIDLDQSDVKNYAQQKSKRALYYVADADSTTRPYAEAYLSGAGKLTKETQYPLCEWEAYLKIQGTLKSYPTWFSFSRGGVKITYTATKIRRVISENLNPNAPELYEAVDMETMMRATKKLWAK